MKKLLIAYALIFILLCGYGCTDAEKANYWSSLGSEHHVMVFSGGVKVGDYHSTGKVVTEQNSDGYLFTDKKTGKLIRVAGTVIIVQE
jgi:hypothetical protein